MVGVPTYFLASVSSGTRYSSTVLKLPASKVRFNEDYDGQVPLFRRELREREKSPTDRVSKSNHSRRFAFRGTNFASVRDLLRVLSDSCDPGIDAAMDKTPEIICDLAFDWKCCRKNNRKQKFPWQ
jgi:hypothetical protein